MFSKRSTIVFVSACVMALVASASSAEASHDLFARVSAGEVNGNGDSINTFRGASADGSRVFFVTNEKLVPTDTDIFEDIYERSGGRTTLISAGNHAFNSFFEDASADGSRVVFSTREKLASNDTDAAFDLYERSTGTTTLVTEGEINGNGDFPAPFFGASADGSRIFFGTSEQLVPSDTDSEFDLYQRFQGVTRRVSVGAGGGNGNGFPAIFRGASADGSSVIFDTRERLDPADTDNSIDAYMRSAGTTTLVTAGEVNGNGPFDISFRGISPSGSRAFFETNEQLVNTDTDGARDLYERSSGATTLVSTGDVGGNGPNDAFFAASAADGSRVFFQTDEQLTGDDLDNQLDIYERSGGITRLISAGQINGNAGINAFFVRASDDGSRVLFFTNEQLDPADMDGTQDLYQRTGGTTLLVSTGDQNIPVSSFGGASKDGSRVFYTTNEQLVADDVDLSQDVYEWVAGNTSLISPGGFTNASNAEAVGVSDDGTRAFFTTKEPIIQNDLDTNFDIYGAYTAAGSGPAGVGHDLFGRISTGEINGNGGFGASLVGASANGSRAFFVTPEQLVGGDSDNSTDLYERSGGTTKRVSAGEVNGNGAFTVNFSGSSADGSRVFFNTTEQLVTDDTDSSIDVYQRFGGVTKRISVGAVNGNGNFGAFFERTSDDGSKVLFTTNEQLVAGDTDSATDIYQRSGTTTKRISVGAVNGNGDFPASFQGASDDGSSVFFRTNEPLAPADTDSKPDLYERTAGSTSLVSVGQINGNGPFNVFFEGASADGSRVFFETPEKLVTADTDSEFDVYERSGGTTTRISTGSVNGNDPFGAHFSGSSADGSKVFFETREHLVTGDTDTKDDVYRRSGGATSRISAGQVNGNGEQPANFRATSDDGSRVFFETREKLVSADTDVDTDVYERADGTTRLISAGQVNGNGAIPAILARISTDGSRVFFQTSEQLVPEDTDTNTDIYERALGKTRLITPGSQFVAFTDASDDGSVVFFNTTGSVIASDVDGVSDDYGAYVAP